MRLSDEAINAVRGIVIDIGFWDLLDRTRLSKKLTESENFKLIKKELQERALLPKEEDE